MTAMIFTATTRPTPSASGERRVTVDTRLFPRLNPIGLKIKMTAMNTKDIIEHSFLWDLQIRGRTGESCRPDAVMMPQTSLTGRGPSTQRYCGGVLSAVDFALAGPAAAPTEGPAVSSQLITYQTPFR